jgi:methylenetetrahydrofolate dehydrogenase (NADP+)/methenyltetrahydrofolate cyclohydrolase
MDRSGTHFAVDLETLRNAAQSAEPKLLDGKRISVALLAEVQRASTLLDDQGISAHLAVVRVGNDQASKIYVRHKMKACERAGIKSSYRHLSGDISQDELFETLDELNDDPAVNGILLQLPLPDQLNPQMSILRIDPRKDVDGFHPVNLGFLMAASSELEPCTPRGIMTMLRAAGVKCKGKKAVVIGRSMIVGRPMSQMLVRAHATVTTCHRHTADLADHVSDADIVVVATGVPELVKGEWIKQGAVVADVGITRSDEGRLVGDVEFAAAYERASLITPVPGGVGPMTVATLLENTIRASCAHHGLAIRGGELVEEREAAWAFSDD